MAHQIRRNSMEHLEVYDLDKLMIRLSANKQLPPPLPPPRKHQQYLPTRSTFERYQFLCDMKRHKTDPVYAATPMFRTIPHSKPITYPRRLLGSYVPLEIIKPVMTTSPKSPEPENARTDDEKEESTDEDADRNLDDDDDDDDREERDQPGNSSSSSDDNNDDNILGDDDNKKGIVEQIFNRDKK